MILSTKLNCTYQMVLVYIGWVWCRAGSVCTSSNRSLGWPRKHHTMLLLWLYMEQQQELTDELTHWDTKVGQYFENMSWDQTILSIRAAIKFPSFYITENYFWFFAITFSEKYAKVSQKPDRINRCQSNSKFRILK